MGVEAKVPSEPQDTIESFTVVMKDEGLLVSVFQVQSESMNKA